MILLSSIALGSPKDCVHTPRRMGRPQTTWVLISGTHPLRVHFDRDQDEVLAEEVLKWAERAWDVQIDELGFREPALPDGKDGPDLDFYLQDQSWTEAWTEPDRLVDFESGDDFMGATAWCVLSRRLPFEEVPTFVAHEFNHLLQWNTDFTEERLPIWEAVANSSQLPTLTAYGYDAADTEWDEDVKRFQEVPWAPTLVGDGTTNLRRYDAGRWFEYGAALWVMHLDHTVGAGDGSIGVDLWEETANKGWRLEPDLVDAVLAVSEEDLAHTLHGIARSRVLVGSDWDDRGIPAAEAWKGNFKVARDFLDGDDLPRDLRVEPPLDITGQAFFEIDLRDVKGQLTVSVDTRDDHEPALSALLWSTDGTVDERLPVVGDEASLTVATGDLKRMVVVVSNLGPPGWDGDDAPYQQDVTTVGFRWGSKSKNRTKAACGCRSAGGSGPFGLALLVLLARRCRTSSLASCSSPTRPVPRPG